MRATPPFDPRLQQGGIYVAGPPQPFRQPIIHPNTLPQPNYPPGPQFTQNYAPQTFSIPQQHQIITNPIPNQPGSQLPPTSVVPNKVEAPKPQMGFSNQMNQMEANNTMQNKYQQNLQTQQHYQQGQEGEEEQDMKNQQIIMFWEHKFYTILQRFQLIFEKVQGFRIDFQHLNEELRAVDSEEEWNQAKEHHEDYMQQLQQFTQQLAGVINQNASLVDQNENDNNEQLIWKQRYFQLFQGYKVMEQELFELKETKVSSGNQNNDIKMNDLLNNYRTLEREYYQAVSQLSQIKQQKERDNEPSAVDKNYREKLDYALRQAEKYKDLLEQLSKQNEQMDGLINELKSDKKNLEIALESNMQANVHQNYEQFKRAISERDQEINLLSKQLKDLSERYNYLVESHNMMQNKLQQEDPLLKTKISQLEQQLDNKNRESIEFRAKIHEIQLKQKATSSMSEEYQKLIRLKSTQLQQRNDEIQRLKRQIANLNNIRKNQSEKDLSLFKKEYDVKIKKIQDQYQEKLDALKKKLRKKQQEGENTALLNIKIQSLEKKHKILLQQIENLNAQLNSKQKQIMQIKRLGHSQQKVKQLQYQYNLILEQKQNLNATLVQRNFELDSLQTQVNQFEYRIKQLSSKTLTSNSKPLIAEIQQLNNLIHLKQSQINKNKNNMNLKEGQIKELQREVQKAKNTIIVNEKNFQKQKDILQQSLRSLERKNQQNEKKMRDLQYEFGSIMKKNLQDEIKNLRAQNQSRQQNIIRLEAEQLELKSRISHYQRVRSTHSGDIQQLSNRVKQLQTSKFEMIRKMESSFRQIKKKQRESKQLADTVKQLKDKIIKLQGQIVLNQKLIKQKDTTIENLEGQVLVTNSRLAYITQEHDNLRMRRRDETDLFFKESDELKRKLFEYEHINGSKKELKQKFTAGIAKIQNEIIQKLTEEKQFLQHELSAALSQIGNVPTNDPKSNQVRKSKASAGIDYIQKRLFQFNNKIDDIIVKNRQLSSRQFGSNRENINLQSSRTNNRENQQLIKSLKNQITQLRKYISKLQIESGGQIIKYNPRNEVIFAQQQKTYNERIQFYQNQTNQLESRIENLLRVNNTLKERLDSLLKGEHKNSTVAFYKEQLSISQDTIQVLNEKIKKLVDENRNLKNNNNQGTTKMCRQYQDKIFECENKIFGLQRKISNLELQRIKTENQRAIIQKNLNSVQSQLHSIKSANEKQSRNIQKNNKELSDQVVTYENQIEELLSKVRLLESENNRLSQAMHTTYSQQHILLNTPVKGSPKNSFKK